MADVRLIDANELIDVIESTDWYHVSLQGNLVHGARSDIHTPLYKADDIYKALNNAPTINPEDCRPHGRWTETNWAECDGHGEVITFHDITALRCSNCCYCFKKELLWRKNYCPNCGAKMDGKEQQEKACDTCRFNPPSSFDGKPCSQCSDDYSCWQRKEQDNA